jgi:hypothetical protein
MEGNPDHFFVEEMPIEEIIQEEEQGGLEVPTLEGNEHDLMRLLADGYEVDDDNEPAPENAPTLAPSGNTGVTYSDWGFSGICQRRAENCRNEKAHIRSVTSDIVMGGMDFITMFLIFMPKVFFETVLLVETNKAIQGQPVSFGEFLQFIGIWLYMATTAGYNRAEWFSSKNVDRWEGAPCRFNDVMSGRRFDAIIAALRFTNVPFPPFEDKFHEVRQLITAWNDNMTEMFAPSWVSCLDESMSKWTSRWTCPGFMFVPRKPWPMGNEYHSVCCALSGIMFSIELVEGRDRPRQLGPAEHNSLGKTVGLMWRMCKPLFHSGKVVILDSGFCVLQGIIELKKVGVFAAALIKKRRYWPKHVDGDGINTHFADKPIGYSDALPGVLDGVRFNLFCMKEPDYVMMLMSTYGTTSPKDGQKDTRRHYKNAQGQIVTTIFKYPEVVGNHYSYRGCVDDHNNRRQDGGKKQGLSLEGTWKTYRWPVRVFAFILAITEVNTYLAWVYFTGAKIEFMAFRKQLAHSLIYNKFVQSGRVDNEPRRGRKRRSVDHTLTKAPLYARRWTGDGWDLSAKNKYQQYICKTPGCKTPVRTYCMCTPGTWICAVCMLDHVVDEVASISSEH